MQRALVPGRITRRAQLAIAKSASKTRISLFGEKFFARHEAAAGEPTEGAPAQDLDVHCAGVVLYVLLAVAPEPVAHLLLRVEPRGALAVDEEVVLRHRANRLR